MFVEMNKLFSGTSVAPVPLFFLLHNLIHDSLEFVVEFLVVYRLGQFPVVYMGFIELWGKK